MFNSEKFEEMLQSTTDLKDYVDTPYITQSESFEDESELREYLEERINECEVIYYSTAIKYLGEKDPSLMESLALASEYGFSIEKLNSETLATLLLQQNLQQELADLDLDECFTADSEEVQSCITAPIKA